MILIFYMYYKINTCIVLDDLVQVLILPHF